MNDESIPGGNLLSVEQAQPMVARSDVPLNLPYNEYKPYLRPDFFWSCGYCTMMEYEASAIRFTIDHYAPRGVVEIDVEAYDNLIYCCDECNTLKGNRYPPQEARDDGRRFFRPDHDVFDQHFAVSGIRIEGLSVTGRFTIDFLNLNRQSLRRLRDYRNRIVDCYAEVDDLTIQLGSIRIDRLPSYLRARAINAIKQAKTAANDRVGELEHLLETMARSPNADKDPDAQALANHRAIQLKELKALYPGSWATPRQGRE